MISRSCIPTLDLSAPLSFDPGEFIMFKVMGKLRTEGAPEMAERFKNFWDAAFAANF
jgi:hypothetical protein